MPFWTVRGPFWVRTSWLGKSQNRRRKRKILRKWKIWYQCTETRGKCPNDVTKAPKQGLCNCDHWPFCQPNRSDVVSPLSTEVNPSNLEWLKRRTEFWWDTLASAWAIDVHRYWTKINSQPDFRLTTHLHCVFQTDPYQVSNNTFFGIFGTPVCTFSTPQHEHT